MKEILSRYKDTTIPYKMDMLATHFNGKLSEQAMRKQATRITSGVRKTMKKYVTTMPDMMI